MHTRIIGINLRKSKQNILNKSIATIEHVINISYAIKNSINLQTYVAADRGVARNKIQRMSCGVAARGNRKYTRQYVRYANIPRLSDVSEYDVSNVTYLRAIDPIIYFKKCILNLKSIKNFILITDNLL